MSREVAVGDRQQRNGRGRRKDRKGRLRNGQQKVNVEEDLARS